MSTPHRPTATTRAPVITASRRGAMLQVMASLLWLPQAWLIAACVQHMADGFGMASVVPLAAGVLALGGLRAWLDGAGGLRANLSARDQLSALREQVAMSLTMASPMDRARVTSGEAASAMAEQAEAIVPWLSRYQSAMLRTRLVPLVIVLAVGWYSWVAALILLVAAPLIPLFMAIVGWRAQSASEEQMVELGGMNAFLLDRLRGMSTLRGLHAVDAAATQLREHAQSLRHRTMKVLRIAFLSSAVLELFSALGVAMVAVYIGFHLLGTLHFGAWGGKLSLDAALFVLLLAPAFFEPLRELSAVWHDRAAGEAALHHLHTLEQQGMQLPGARVDVGVQPQGAVALEIEELCVHVPGTAAVLPPISFGVARGEHVALWAPSGTGKSVLLAQIAALVPHEGGSIRIDGEMLTTDNAAQLRARMAWMGQQPHVFAGSVHRNIGLGREDVSAREVQHAISVAALERALEGRAGASLGEGGMGISGGEAVRLAMARLAVNADAGLLLVDEPTAHLDPQTGLQIIESLRRIARGRTMLVATHDAQLARRMDRIIVLGVQTQAQPDEEMA